MKSRTRLSSSALISSITLSASVGFAGVNASDPSSFFATVPSIAGSGTGVNSVGVSSYAPWATTLPTRGGWLALGSGESRSGVPRLVSIGGPGTRGTSTTLAVMNPSGAAYAGCSGSGHAFGRSHTIWVALAAAGGPSIGARTWTSHPGWSFRYSTRCRAPVVTSSG